MAETAGEEAVGTSTPGTWPPREPESGGRLGPRDHRLRIGALVVLLAAASGLIAWSASDPTGYTTSGNGCVTVSIASTMGGSIRRECGDAARSWCRSAYTQRDAHNDQLALLTQRQCQLAGLDRETVSGP